MASFKFEISREPEKGPEKKFFTLAEALRALPLVKRIAVDIQAAQATRLKVHGELSSGLANLPAGRQAVLQQDFDAATHRLEALIRELTDIGVELKDPARALLDFPAMFEGREILLCWKAGEDTISFWHELEGGYAGRKPVSILHE